VRLLNRLKTLVCGGDQGDNTVSFTDDEVKTIEATRQKLRNWLELAKAGIIGVPAEQGLKADIMDIVNVSNQLYEWYVPSFQVSRIQLTELELRRVVSDIANKGGLQDWLRLDGNYYTVDEDTFKKIVEWDWTDTRKYITDTFDCDKFAMYFKARMAIDFGVNAVGVILDYSSGHAYNLVIFKNQQGVEWYLYEPQNDNMFTYEQRDQSLYAMRQFYLIL
jgi:hypothetical protein